MWIYNVSASEPDRHGYYDELRRRQQEHLDNVRDRQYQPWQPCMHDGCSECVGTGIKRDGTPCIHMISCPCPRCRPMML